jgi:hypothetical protein
MKKNTIKTALITALVASFAIVVSGCSKSAAPTAKVKTEFKQTLDTQNVKSAVVSASKENGWEVLKPSSTTKGLHLKKTISTRETVDDARGRNWNKVMVSKDILADVTINEKSYQIELSKDSKKYLSNYYSNKHIQNDLKELQKSIKHALITKTL